MIVGSSFFPFIKKRLDFERLNLTTSASMSFKVLQKKADLCFEISSEGELEQSRALIERALKLNKSIEILYSSPSVEGKCHNLYLGYPDQVRVLRIPFLSFSPFSFLYFQSVWQWVTSDVIIFCRYDFFPELLLFKYLGKKLILISGAFKKMNWYKRESFKLFSSIVAATDLECENFKKLGFLSNDQVKSCDFRILRILERKNKAQALLSSKENIQDYLNDLKIIPMDQKIILGSAWASDLTILDDQKLIEDLKNNLLHLCIVPHILSNENLNVLKDKLNHMVKSDNLVQIYDGSKPFVKSPIILFKTSGILCELYSLFQVSYVGGGYERSIHSVLEPFFMHAEVIVGPKIHRSTELDLVREILPDEIHVLKSPNSFYNLFMSIRNKKLNTIMRTASAKKGLDQSEELFKVLIEGV